MLWSFREASEIHRFSGKKPTIYPISHHNECNPQHDDEAEVVLGQEQDYRTENETIPDDANTEANWNARLCCSDVLHHPHAKAENNDTKDEKDPFHGKLL